MLTRSLIAMVAVLALVCTGMEDSKIKLDDVKCVVNPKNDAKADKTLDYKEGKVFFCCDGCPKAFTKDTEKFATSANHQLVATGQYAQTKCPLTGKDLNPDQKVKVGGVEVTLCCGGCKGKVAKAEGAAQAELVFSDKAFEKGGFEPVKKDE